MGETEHYYQEAERIAFYLVGKGAGERERRIYGEAMGKLNLVLSASERRLWERMLRGRRWMAWADAGLALLEPASVLRRKIFVMLAVLEASPDYADHFLSERFGRHEGWKAAAAVLRAGGRAVAGVVMLKLGRF